MEVAYTTWGFVGPLINPICSVLMRKETIYWIFIKYSCKYPYYR